MQLSFTCHDIKFYRTPHLYYTVFNLHVMAAYCKVVATQIHSSVFKAKNITLCVDITKHGLVAPLK